MRSAVVDGFVAHCDALDDERRTIVEDRRLPIVVLDGRPAPADPSVDIDEEGGARAAADHVLSLGHRRLAVVRFQPLTTGMFNTWPIAASPATERPPRRTASTPTRSR